MVYKSGIYVSSADHMNRPLSAAVSPKMAKAVSGIRRETLEEEVSQNKFGNDNQSTLTPAGFVTSNQRGFSKLASQLSSSYQGSGGTVRQATDIYSPLWLNSNLNLPRDQATINMWSRAFFALNGLVQNAISLHSTYPISKLNIKCKNPEVEKFFADMIEEIDLMNICVQIAQEYWILGEAFVYAELDEHNRKWSRLLIQNPDYITVQRSVVADEPIISLRPDDNLRRICNSNRPSDVQERQKLDRSIIEHVKRGENIPLNNFYVSHLARKINPYDVHGTGLIVSSFRQLMLFDQLRECYSIDTEVLTDQGFKHIWELVETTNDLNVKHEYVVGAEQSGDGKLDKLVALKNNIKVACVDPETNELQYHVPEEFHMSNYSGKMVHFHGKKVDVLVTPNHKMWFKEHTNGKWGKYSKRPASEILDKKKYYKFNSKSIWKGKEIDYVDVISAKIPIELYLKFLGYFASECCAYMKCDDGRYDATVILSQATSSDCYEDMRNTMNQFADLLNKKCGSRVRTECSGYSVEPIEMWEGRIHGKDITQHFKDEVGIGENSKSHYKHLPRWVFDLSPRLLNILLKSLVFGDGSEAVSKYGTESKNFRYSTVSKQLADDVYELVYKVGHVPTICVSNKTVDDRHVTEYIVLWSDTAYGNEPIIYTGIKRPKGTGGGASVEEVDYNGQVWCFTVPTGLFVTRRNNHITIQGNSKFAQASNMINPLTLVKIGGDVSNPNQIDLEAWREVFENAQSDKDFKIFCHDKVTVERVGYNSGIIDIGPDITQLIKEIYTGLMVPSVLMDGGSDTTYANGGVALDVLRQRYMQFRNMLTIWLRRKIFAPIAKINDFYDYKDGKKVLIVPDVEWNHMSLFDAGDYITTLSSLATADQKKVSHQTLYRSLGLSWEDEIQKIRQEDIQDAIRKKEQDSLAKMSLNELRALGPGDEIKEPNELPVPGEQALPGQEMGGMESLPGIPPPPGEPLPAPPAPSAPPSK